MQGRDDWQFFFSFGEQKGSGAQEVKSRISCRCLYNHLICNHLKRITSVWTIKMGDDGSGLRATGHQLLTSCGMCQHEHRLHLQSWTACPHLPAPSCTWFSKSAFFSLFCSSLSCSLASLSCTSCRAACFFRRPSMAILSSPSAAASLIFLGATIFATLQENEMGRWNTHLIFQCTTTDFAFLISVLKLKTHLHIQPKLISLPSVSAKNQSDLIPAHQTWRLIPNRHNIFKQVIYGCFQCGILVVLQKRD